jgi:hypothetical protein
MTLTEEDKDWMRRDAQDMERRDAFHRARLSGLNPTFDQYLEWITDFSRFSTGPSREPWRPFKITFL